MRPLLPVWALAAARAWPRSPRVALMTRSFAGDELYFRPWFASIEMYWPWRTWPVIIVLDDEPEDFALAESFPAWATVHHEPLPRHAASWPSTVQPGRAMKRSIAYMRVNWDQWHFDRYTDAQYIALTDVDVVFHTWATESMLFHHRKPRVFGHCPRTWRERGDVKGWDLGVSVGAANMVYVAEFMFYLPFMIETADLGRARRHLTERAQRGIGNRSDFERWFLDHARLTLEYDPHTSNSMQNVLGHYMWSERRGNFSWHIEPTLEDGRVVYCTPFKDVIGPSAFSPVFHVATHLTMVKNVDWHDYRNTAHSLIWSGWCGVGNGGATIVHTHLREAIKCLKHHFFVLPEVCDYESTIGNRSGAHLHYLFGNMLVSHSDWPSAWHQWGMVGGLPELVDAFGIGQWMQRVVGDGDRGIRELLGSCGPHPP